MLVYNLENKQTNFKDEQDRILTLLFWLRLSAFIEIVNFPILILLIHINAWEISVSLIKMHTQCWGLIYLK